MPDTVYTIGHSNHELEQFIALLTPYGITAVADVRSSPYGRLEHFGRESLAAALKAAGIRYVYMGRELGARREENACYENGQALYDRIGQLPLFQEGLQRLHNGAKHQVIAVMCSEKEPLDCHRTILIARHLRRFGLSIRHILADGTIETQEELERRLVEAAEVERTLFEPDLTQEELVERAYDKRGPEIAYRAEEQGVTE